MPRATLAERRATATDEGLVKALSKLYTQKYKNAFKLSKLSMV